MTKKPSETKKSKKIDIQQADTPLDTTKKSSSNRRLFIAGSALLLVIIVLSFAIPSIVTRSKNKSTQADKVIVDVQKILLLPKDSEPTIIEVSDVGRLKNTNPEFYKDVEKGDYILMYPGKAVIYRHSNNQIINVAPIE